MRNSANENIIFLHIVSVACLYCLMDIPCLFPWIPSKWTFYAHFHGERNGCILFNIKSAFIRNRTELKMPFIQRACRTKCVSSLILLAWSVSPKDSHSKNSHPNHFHWPDERFFFYFRSMNVHVYFMYIK